MYGVSFDPISGRLRDFSADPDADFGRRQSVPRGGYLNRIHPVERRVLRWLFGVDDESLSAEEIAERMQMTADQVWHAAERGLAEVGLYALNESATLIEEAA